MGSLSHRPTLSLHCSRNLRTVVGLFVLLVTTQAADVKNDCSKASGNDYQGNTACNPGSACNLSMPTMKHLRCALNDTSNHSERLLVARLLSATT